MAIGIEAHLGDAPAGAGAFADWRLWDAAILVGLIARGPSIYLSLRAIKLAGAMTYVAAMAALPVAAFAFVAGFMATGLLPSEPIEFRLLAYGLVASAGSLLVVLARSRARAR